MRSLGRSSRQVVISSFLLGTLLAWHVEAIAGQLTLTWLDNSSDEGGFSIERSTGAPGAFGEIGTTSSNVTSYTDLSVATGTAYCYRLRAFNAAGYSGYSNVACATAASTFGLAVVKAGTGTGTVTSVPAGISCGTSCSESYAAGMAVTLTATPVTGSTFTGWSGGGCSGTGTCTVAATTTVTATFSPTGTATFTPPPSRLPFDVTLLLNQTIFSSGYEELILGANVHVNVAFTDPIDAYLDLRDPFGSVHLVKSYVNVRVPSVDFSVLVADGPLAAFLSSPANGPQAASLPPADGPLAASLPAGAYTLSLVAVRAGGDPENLADRLSNFASIFFTVSNPFQIQ